MPETNLSEQILQMMKELLETDVDNINAEQTFEELGIDSIIFIRMVVQCETQFGIQFEDEMLVMQKFPDAAAFINYVQARYDIAQNPPAQNENA